MFQPGDIVFGIKATRSDGLDFHTGTIDYGAHVGKWLEVDAAPYNAGQCARGIHFSPKAIDCCRIMSGNGSRPWRFYELAVAVEDIVWPRLDGMEGQNKWRARRVFVVRELPHEDPLVFGENIAARVKRCRETAGTWKEIPWLKPASPVADETVVALVAQWRDRLSAYLPDGRAPLPVGVRIVRTRDEATKAAAAAAGHLSGAAAADAADAAADAAAAADADAAAAAAADAAAADAAAAAADAADADAAAAADADAAADDAAAAAAVWRPSWLWWYVRPYNVLRRHAWWALGGLDENTDPSAPLVELYRLGCFPIGYVRGQFVVYAPQVGGQ